MNNYYLQEAFSKLNKLNESYKYLNNMDIESLNLLNELYPDNTPDYLATDETEGIYNKCNKSAIKNLLYFLDRKHKDVTYCVGAISIENDKKCSGNIVTHVWLVVEGNIIETNFPQNNLVKHKRFLIDSINLSKDDVDNSINLLKQFIINKGEN